MWKKGRVYKPVENMDVSAASKEEYIQEKVLVPRAFGILLKFFSWALETWIIGSVVMFIIKWGNMIPEFFTYAHIKEPPMYYPKFPEEEFDEQDVIYMHPDSTAQEKATQVLNCLMDCTSRKKTENEPFFRRWTIRDFSRAYVSGEVTPTEVAERFLSAVEQSIKHSPQMFIFISYNSVDILKQAAESTSRYKRGEPLSVLDGVPIAVKDEIDCLPYPTTGGTKWLHKVRKVTGDSTCIKQLRACGAVLVGKTNMHELGVGTTGINPHYGATRNPYDTERISGGSSSGSAAAVSAGLCPATLGVDGGGSVRMPAALCGVTGFKPTYGRLCHSGVLPLNWTVGMLGILASSVEDVLIVYAAIVGHSLSKSVSLPPHIRLPLLEKSEGIRDLKLAKYTKWFDDCEDAVRSACYKALNLIKLHYGCEILEVTLPELEEMRRAHYITIGCECDSSFSHDFKNVGLAKSGGDARVQLSAYSSFSSREFLNAQRHKSRQMHFHMEIFKKASVIVTPTTGRTAYPIQKDALKYGEIDYGNSAELMRYQLAGNFLGLPAITIPVGYDASGMPIGLQFIGRPWSEATLLRLACATEGVLD
ncbi:fatty acid amide hydrolase isoform X2 [Cryptomeria japonica]|uniref:fatty acid amide hydrolase isoform X2 n=1 Tax=Cryptomeria japonica TaxID=3369 RepID=UPI0027DA11DB|nr:fatty acid amide hydrolase isoform X2 [Cryptomeria japonica]